MSLDDSFAQLLGRQPNDHERQQLYRVRDALGIASNDALWLVLMALQHYETLYAAIPAQMSKVCSETLSEFRVAAEHSATAAAEETKGILAKSIAATSEKIARDVAGKERAQWVVAAALACCLALTLTGWAMYTNGQKAGQRLGFVDGYERAKDEVAAASWANTPSGRQALRFAKTGSIEYLAACAQPGWRQEDGICYPERAADGHVYGWRLR